MSPERFLSRVKLSMVLNKYLDNLKMTKLLGLLMVHCTEGKINVQIYNNYCTPGNTYGYVHWLD